MERALSSCAFLGGSDSGGFIKNDEVRRYLLARYKRVETKLREATPDLLKSPPYRPNQFELVGLVGKYPEIDVVPAVLGGEGTETGKSLDAFCKLVTGFKIVTPVFKIFFLRLQFSTSVWCVAFLSSWVEYTSAVMKPASVGFLASKAPDHSGTPNLHL